MKTLEDYACALIPNIVDDDDSKNPSGNPATVEIWDDCITIATIHPAYGTPKNSVNDKILHGGPTREEYARLFAESYRMLKILENMFTASHIDNDITYYEIKALLQRLDLIA